MSHNLCRVFVHLVWTTKHRVPMLTPDIERRVWGALRRAAVRHGCGVRAVGGVEDHVHVLLWLHPTCAIATVVRAMKAAASGLARRHLNRSLPWQRGYGAFPVGPRQKHRVERYIDTQREHHAHGTTIRALERVPIDDDASHALDAGVTG